MYVTGKVLEEAFGVTPRRILQLAADGIIPLSARGQYPLGKCVAAYYQFMNPEKVEEELSLSAERAALAKSQRERVQIEVAQKRC